MASTFNLKLAFVAVLVLALLVCQAMSRNFIEVSMTEKHKQWMARYRRVYKDDAEKAKRYRIFTENVEFIESFNKGGNQTYKLGINQFADLTIEEFRAARNGYKPLKVSKLSTSFTYENVSEVPSVMDWRKNGAVTEVKSQSKCGKLCIFCQGFPNTYYVQFVANGGARGLAAAVTPLHSGRTISPVYMSSILPPQNFLYYYNVAPPNMNYLLLIINPFEYGNAGSCWAFSAVGAVEGIHQLKTGELISLSEQELVDCDINGENVGCGGGYMVDAFKFIIKNGGLANESSYPYQGVDGTCETKKEASHVATISGYETVPPNNEAALLKAVANQPVSIAIDASSYEFMFYASGIFNGHCSTDLDHGVVAVGYGTNSDGTKYWLVKNSYGTSWGENGYIRMKRDVEAKEGLCGIAMDASYPTA